MRNGIEAVNAHDERGAPTGGYVTGVGIQIDWQNGPLGRGAERKPPNGAFVEDVIEAARQRIEFYQTVADGRFACMENAFAIELLERALANLDSRTQRRERAGVEGTHTPDTVRDGKGGVP